MNVQHSSRCDEWYSPIDIVERARATLGHIDLDPASDEFGNSRIRASEYYDRQTDALSIDWNQGKPVSVYLNCPGGKLGNQSRAALFWKKLMQLREAGGLAHAIFMGFSAEQMQTTQGKGVPSICDFYVCVPARRIRFDRADGKTDSRSPSHSNVIVYVSGTIKNLTGFVANFADLGAIMGPI